VSEKEHPAASEKRQTTISEKEHTIASEKEQTTVNEKEHTTVSERELTALKTVKRYMWWSMGAGLVPVPLLDLAAVSGVQLKMLAEISRIYDVPFQKSRVKAVIGSLIGSVVPGAVSYGAFSSLCKTLPVVGTTAGTATMVLFSGASAWALGKVFIQHFESGGTFLDFKPEEVKEYFKAQFEEGRKATTTMRTEKKADAPA
jgi:uncharacterized protein (DUF697 family)